MSEYLDYIHVMSYDYHILEGGVIMPNAPLDEVVCIAYSIVLFIALNELYAPLDRSLNVKR
jgi:spore germination protein YaaH